MQKKKAHRLQVGKGDEIFVLAIVSHENDYRLSWGINNVLGWQLVRGDNHQPVNDGQPEAAGFSLYGWHDEINFIRYDLIANRSSGALLLSQLRNVDYILMLTGEISFFDIDNLLKELKSIPGVSTAFYLSDLPAKQISLLPQR